jgi:hypothetical protein
VDHGWIKYCKLRLKVKDLSIVRIVEKGSIVLIVHCAWSCNPEEHIVHRHCGARQWLR